MSDNKLRENDERKRRVRRLKKIVIVSLVVSIIIPIVMCIGLAVQIGHLNRNLAQIEQNITSMSELVHRQREELDRLNQFVNTAKEEKELSKVEAAPDSALEDMMSEVDGSRHKVYLTFDDGPSSYTKEILDILDRYQVKATFFVVGKDSDWAREALSDIVARGHSLGMHSYSHKYSELYQSRESFAEDFEKLQTYLYEVTGVESHIYRFPGGSSNTVSNVDINEFATFLEEKDVVYFDWNIASGDAASRKLSVDEIVKNATKDIERRETSIILFHDASDKNTTVEALPIIIEKILEMEDTEILPITDDTEHIQHIN